VKKIDMYCTCRSGRTMSMIRRSREEKEGKQDELGNWKRKEVEEEDG
jgi:hypothetical protein